MKIAAISDTHSHPLPKIVGDLTADVLIIAGDWSYKAEFKEIEGFKEYLKIIRPQFQELVYVNGNHELGMEAYPYLNQEVAQQTDAVYLENSHVVLNIRGRELKIWGSPVTPYFGGWAYNYRRGPEIRRVWGLIPEGMDIVVTHGPMYRTGMDYLPWDDKYVGCEDLREVLVNMENSPKYHISGHIHLTAGKTFMLRTNYDKIINCMNVSICNEAYEPVNSPTVFYI